MNNNIATFATAGVYRVISVFRELATYDEWLLKTQEENKRLNGIIVLDDGTPFEAASIYVVTLLGTILTPYILQETLIIRYAL